MYLIGGSVSELSTPATSASKPATFNPDPSELEKSMTNMPVMSTTTTKPERICQTSIRRFTQIEMFQFAIYCLTNHRTNFKACIEQLQIPITQCNF